MKIVIAGAGNVGYYLARTLVARHHRVSVVDDDLERCRFLDAGELGRRLDVTCGDATDERILRDAGAAHCDAFIAATGQDQNNLTACLLAKERLGAGRTITRVNNPRNIRVFQQLGVDSVISSAARIADVIEQELDWADIDRLLEGKAGGTRIRPFVVAEGSPAAGGRVARLGLPAGVLIAVVVRGDVAFLPDGSSVLAPGDECMVLGAQAGLAAVSPLFYGGKEA